MSTLKYIPGHGSFKFCLHNLYAVGVDLRIGKPRQLLLRAVKQMGYLLLLNNWRRHRIIKLSAVLSDPICDFLAKLNEILIVHGLNSYDCSHALEPFRDCDIQPGQIITHYTACSSSTAFRAVIRCRCMHPEDSPSLIEIGSEMFRKYS